MGYGSRKLARRADAGLGVRASGQIRHRPLLPGNQALLNQQAGQGGGSPGQDVTGQRLGLQAKLMVGPRDDPFERQADRAADRMLAGGGTISSSGQGEALIQRMTADTEEEEKEEEEPQDTAQAKAMSGTAGGSPLSANMDGQLAALGGGGQALPSPVRRRFQSHLRVDLGRVKVHTGSRAANIAQALGAHAFTRGRKIYFNQDRYAPHTAEGARLLAHELAHVQQQARNEKEFGRRLQLWRPSGHRELTSDGARAVARNFPNFTINDHAVGRLAAWSRWMDFKIRELAFNVGSKLLNVPIIGRLLGRNIQDYYSRHPSRALNHGEGGLYSTPRPEAARRNRRRQEEYESGAGRLFDSLPRVFPTRSDRDRARESVFEVLGDALHVAQDRGAHGEGARGEGHSRPGFDPDDRNQNPRGYQEAGRNTRGVLSRARSILLAFLGRPRTPGPETR